MYLAILIILVVLLILLSLISIKLRLRLLVHFDILCNRQGFYSIRFFKIPLFSGKIEMKGNKFVITDKKGKSNRIKITTDIFDEESIINYLDNALFSVMDVLDLDAYMTVGKSDDTAFAAVMTSTARIVSALIINALKKRYPRMTCTQGIVPDFTQDELYISLNSIFTVSVADIIYSLIYASKRSTKAKEKNENKSKLKEKVYD